jgi:hypothetical protein
MRILLVCTLCFLQLASKAPEQASSTPPSAANSATDRDIDRNQDLLERKYKEGEKLSYHMTASNRDRVHTLHYEIQADGVVKKDAAGYFEEFAWSGLIVDGKPVELPPTSRDLRQILSLEPNPRLAMPDLSKVHPMMIGPITDLLSFYADMLIAKYQGKLARAGDHFYFPHGTPNSWADGFHVILGQDSIDFDVTLAEIDRKARVATVVVKHVPPEKPQIKLPAAWMEAPVADTLNNWVEVSKTDSGKFIAAVGKEIFVDTIRISLADGRILSATEYNPVEVLQRECQDAALVTCSEPVRFQILRQIEIK